jgi:hypothetical protein
VSLLNRLSQLSAEDIDNLTTGANAAAIRFHPVNWDSKNIPIAKKDLDWLGDYSSEEFTLVQFHLSKAMGRVVGFFDEDQVFNVVLLDPLHNLQPSKDFGYRVRISHISQCELTKLAVTFQSLILSCKYLTAAQQEEMMAQLSAQSLNYFDAAVHLSISEAHLQKAYAFARVGAIKNLGELLEVTIDGLA